jgi:hypothetical protein
MPSSIPISHNSTQMVMAKGNHTNRPVNRYFFIGTKTFGKVNQLWQAQPVLQPPAADATGADSVFAGVDSAAPAAAGVASAAVAPTAGAGVPEPLKSVAYQPEPLSWNPAAVSCLENAAVWQLGHSVSTGSEIFCKTSLANPQALHL